MSMDSEQETIEDTPQPGGGFTIVPFKVLAVIGEKVGEWYNGKE